MKKDLSLPIPIISDALPDNDALVDNNQRTAKKAVKILVAKDNNIYKDLSAAEKRNLVIAFAFKDKIVYGKAFDLVKLENKASVDFSDINDIQQKIKNIIVCEIKSTNKKTKRDNFEGYFFGLSTAELLVAQNLKSNYRFIFVNVLTEDILELTLKQIFEKAKGIYPQWSISF